VCDDGTSQTLVYEMQFDATESVAMILPVPASRDLTFLDLSARPDAFAVIGALFPVEMPTTRGGGTYRPAPLEVQRVGAFDASFAPSLADLPRLDARLALGDGVREALSSYDGYGFAVFRFDAGRGKQHPFGYRYAAIEPALFFPTVHVHDGTKPQLAWFDHALYFQGTPQGTPTDRMGSDVSSAPLPSDIGFGHAGAHVRRMRIRGLRENTDVTVALDGQT
jgi:hypothetical protein